MGCATRTLKFTLLVFNLLWTIAGILLILFGTLGWGGMPQQYALSIIVFGVIVVLISFVGCLGAGRESERILWMYAGASLVLLALLIVFMSFTTHDVFRRYNIERVEDSFLREMVSSGPMDHIQSVYGCCGRDSAEDYVRNGRMIPSSCCRNNNCINPLNIYLQGCISRVEESFADEKDTTQLCLFTFLGLDLAILILSVILAIHYRNRRRRYSY